MFKLFILTAESNKQRRLKYSVPSEGLEPSYSCERWHLKPVCLPIPPQRHVHPYNLYFCFYFISFIIISRPQRQQAGLRGGRATTTAYHLFFPSSFSFYIPLGNIGEPIGRIKNTHHIHAFDIFTGGISICLHIQEYRGTFVQNYILKFFI